MESENNKTTEIMAGQEESLKHTANGDVHVAQADGPASKRQKLDHSQEETKEETRQSQPRDRTRGVAPIKPE